MTIYVQRNGKHVVKGGPEDPPVSRETSAFPLPHVSRMEPYISPTSEKEITSWSERDRDMKAVDAFDVRDLPKGHEFKRGRAAQSKEAKKA